MSDPLFTLALSGRVGPHGCAGHSAHCRNKGEYLATLAYCGCGEAVCPGVDTCEGAEIPEVESVRLCATCAAVVRSWVGLIVMEDAPIRPTSTPQGDT